MAFHPLAALWLRDLHVRTATTFHHSFPWLQCGTVKFVAFRVSQPRHALKTSSIGLRVRLSPCTARSAAHVKETYIILLLPHVAARVGGIAQEPSLSPHIGGFFTRSRQKAGRDCELLDPCFETGSGRICRCLCKAAYRACSS